jgi:PIN domain nuclease of toxin-antitoxin system
LRLLLDTHVALWWVSGDDRLSDEAARQITDDTNQLLLSAAVVWEIAVKRSLGKLAATDEYLSLLLDAGVQALAINLDHAAAVERLPWHHRDPFDRLLVAQAEIERAAIISRDEALAAYEVPVIW